MKSLRTNCLAVGVLPALAVIFTAIFHAPTAAPPQDAKAGPIPGISRSWVPDLADAWAAMC